MKTWDEMVAPSIVENDTAILPTSSSPTRRPMSATRMPTIPGMVNDEVSLFSKTDGSVWLNSNYNSGTNNLVTRHWGSTATWPSCMRSVTPWASTTAATTMAARPPTATRSTGWLYTEDTRQYTIMSYFSAGNTGANWGGKYAQTPMVYDILAIQQMYGADYTTRAGDTVYGFNSTAGRDLYDFTKNTSPIMTIWDGGGIDTIDVSGWSTSSTIFLAAGSYSSVNGMTYNLAIAYDCDIENVTTGAGNDTITGNDLSNIISGGAGNDVVHGAAGSDMIDGGTRR